MTLSKPTTRRGVAWRVKKMIKPPKGLKAFILAMLRGGIQEKEIDTMVKKNPARLLNLD
jgi:predicted metal-dependent phosphotriesterase family hydrolase